MEGSVSNETVVWGVHAVAGDEADNLFLKGNVIAMGFKGIEDMSLWARQLELCNLTICRVIPHQLV
jgi:hypothetical protein